MILLVGFYIDANAARTEEFLECIRRNASNEHIEIIRVFLEDSLSPVDAKARFPALAHQKVQLIAHSRRLTYAELFQHANRYLNGAGVIVANSDIFFDETLALLEEEPLVGRMLCLSRWDETAEGSLRHLDRPDSQDAWVFEPPLPRIASDFCLGKPGCDNRLAYEAERAGLKVSNPSRTLRARHLHHSAVRRYAHGERLNGPIRLVPASFLDTAAISAKRRDQAVDGFPSHRGLCEESRIDARLRDIEAVLAPHFEGVVPHGVRRELLRSLRASAKALPCPANVPLAVVAFRETMGFTVARLELGVSTHNNDPRPLLAIPTELAGLPFTQAVSCRSAPVEIEFRTSGRLFVLASPGWEGYAPAAALLDDAGWREPIEPLRTRCGTIFEPWSIVANAGERLVIPIQVMLAAAELIRME